MPTPTPFSVFHFIPCRMSGPGQPGPPVVAAVVLSAPSIFPVKLLTSPTTPRRRLAFGGCPGSRVGCLGRCSRNRLAGAGLGVGRRAAAAAIGASQHESMSSLFQTCVTFGHVRRGVVHTSALLRNWRTGRGRRDARARAATPPPHTRAKTRGTARHDTANAVPGEASVFTFSCHLSIS